MPRRKKQLTLVGVHEHHGNIRVDLTLGSGERRRISVGAWGNTEALRWSSKREVMQQQIAHGLFRWQDWFSPVQWRVADEPRPESATFGDYVELHLRGLGRLKPQSVATKRSRLRRLSPLNERRLQAILPSDLAGLLSGMSSLLSANSVRSIVVEARGVLELAARDGMISRERLRDFLDTLGQGLPESPRPEKLKYSPEERDLLLETIRGGFSPWLHNYFEFMFFSGLRPSEARALRWDDVDLGAGRLRVRRAKYAEHPEAGPKTAAGRRSLPLAQRAAAALRRQMAITRLAGGGAGLVFVEPSSGGYVDYHRPSGSIAPAWHKAAKMAGLPDHAPYSMRHTFASACLSAGMALGLLSKLLGHANAQVTATTYASWLGDDDIEAAEMSKLDAVSSRIRPEAYNGERPLTG